MIHGVKLPESSEICIFLPDFQNLRPPELPLTVLLLPFKIERVLKYFMFRLFSASMWLNNDDSGVKSTRK